MTVDVLHLQSTENLARPHRFFPAEINVPHHQLRNFISTVHDGRIYYVNNYDIFLLDLQTKKRYLLATVPFEARCLSAAHGWVCVGGELKGDCAFLKVGDGNTKRDGLCHDLVVEMLGKEIVNSMTVHRIQNGHLNKPDEIVVLISNNDKTVTIFSLSRQEVLAVLEHPVPMNYAALSPDSKILAAVGDSNEVYFYERTDVPATSTTAEDDSGPYPEYDWCLLSVPPVPMGEEEYDDYSFAIAFSPTGRMCAVSAQGGAITVFDMQRVFSGKRPAKEAILCTFRSSRTSIFGCVRSMAFSPEPWELLAWAEDHGRIGVADIRQGFIRRQQLELKKDTIEVVEIEDTTPNELRGLGVKERLKLQHSERIRALRGHPPVGARSMDEPRRPHVASREATPVQENLDLDARERSVLEVLETTVDNYERENTSVPFSINYTSTPRLLNPTSRPSTHRQPQRRASVVLSPSVSTDPTNPTNHLSVADSSRALMTASPGPISEDGSVHPMSTNDLTPAAGASASQPMPYNIPPSDPWHVIEASLSASRATVTASVEQPPPPNLLQVEAAISAEQQLSSRLERQLADEQRLSGLLRSELEARERLLEARQHDLRSESRLSPAALSLALNVQRQFQAEQRHGQQRLEELEGEILSNTMMMTQLMDERVTMLHRWRASRDGSNSTTAITSALPTTNAQFQTETLGRTLQQLDDERRHRRQRIQNLELQVRRAESRVELATTHLNVQGRVMQSRPHSTSFPQRALQRDPTNELYEENNSPASAATILRRAVRRTELGISGERATIPSTSQLAGRVTENDMRLARMMLQRAAMDANGNWNSTGLQGLVGGRTLMAQRVSAVEEIMRDGGVGTAGIGWSSNGHSLFVGSEQGIFEFQTNLQDRMQFSVLELR